MTTKTPTPRLKDEAFARELYQDSGKSLDMLAYTPEFENMHSMYCARTGQPISIGNFYRALMNLRKSRYLTQRPGSSEWRGGGAYGRPLALTH